MMHTESIVRKCGCYIKKTTFLLLKYEQIIASIKFSEALLILHSKTKNS